MWRAKEAESDRVKYWDIIAPNLSKAGWSWGCVSAIDANGRMIWIADAHRGDRKRFVVRARGRRAGPGNDRELGIGLGGHRLSAPSGSQSLPPLFRFGWSK